MSSCDRSLVLDRPDGADRLGEAITGRVDVRVGADCACQDLLLRQGRHESAA